MRAQAGVGGVGSCSKDRPVSHAMPCLLFAEPLTLDTKRGNGGAGGRTRVVGGGEARVPDAMSCMRAKLRERGRGKGERSGV